MGFAAAISHARMRLSRLGRIGHAGRIAERVGAVVPPFLSVPDDVGAACWDSWWGGGRAEVALAAWARVFLAELAGSGRRGVEVRVACGSSGGLFDGRARHGPLCRVASGPCVLCGPGRPVVPGPTRGCVLAAVLAGVGVCAVVRFCSAPVRVLCVSPRSRPAPPCVFEQ